MTRELIKAIIFSILIFGSIAFYLFGNALLPSFVFDREKTQLKTKSPKKNSRKSSLSAGQVLDQYKGVNVYNNGSVKNVFGRNTTMDGYNLGLKYQCVEFAKRFYYEVYNHKMPDSYGHAKDFFNKNLSNGEMNTARAMRQFRNKNNTKPKKDDLVIIGSSKYNAFGHLFIITKVGIGYIEIIQQNPGAGNPSREKIELISENEIWIIDSPGVIGWLRI